MASNKRRRHTPDQIIRKLAEGNKLLGAGQELGEVCRHLEIAESTWHRWLAQYGGMKANEAKRLKELEAENARLRRRSPPRRRSCGPGCAGSPRSGPAGVGDGQPRWPAAPVGRSTTSASAGCGVRRAYGSLSAARRSV